MSLAVAHHIAPAELVALEARLEAAVEANPHCPPTVFLRRRVLAVEHGTSGGAEVFVILRSSTWPKTPSGPIFLHGKLLHKDGGAEATWAQFESRRHIIGGTIEQFLASLEDCRVQGFIVEKHVWQATSLETAGQAFEALSHALVGAVEAFVSDSDLNSPVAREIYLPSLDIGMSHADIADRLSQASVEHLKHKKDYLSGYLDKATVSELTHALGYFCANTVATRVPDVASELSDIERDTEGFSCVVAAIVDAELFDSVEYVFIGYCGASQRYVSGLVYIGFVIEASSPSSALCTLSDIMRNGNAAYSGLSLSETFAGALKDLCLLIREHADFYNEPDYPPMLRGSNIQDALAAAHDFYACGGVKS